MRIFLILQAQAYSNASLKQPLTDTQLKRYREIMQEISEVEK